MDLAGWAALLALPAAAVAALYPWLSERGHLSQVERITRVLNDAASGVGLTPGERSALRVIRQRRIEAMAVAVAVPRQGRLLAWAIFGMTWGVLLTVIETVLVVTGGTHTDNPTVWIVYGESVFIFAAGVFAWRRRRSKRESDKALVVGVLRDDIDSRIDKLREEAQAGSDGGS